jgi:hypothetical protein
LIVYVAGPYSGRTPFETDGNLEKAINAGLCVALRGHTPLVPHLSHYIDQRAKEVGVPILYEEWMAHCMALLERCDALLYLGSSPGADRELARAGELGMPTFHSLEALAMHCKVTP